jgi:hypothetical protein
MSALVIALARRVGAVIVVSCPYCRHEHRHGGATLGHRIAHCREADGRGYVLRLVEQREAA